MAEHDRPPGQHITWPEIDWPAADATPGPVPGPGPGEDLPERNVLSTSDRLFLAAILLCFAALLARSEGWL